MDEWKPVFVLPNLQMREPIEGHGIALASADDPRIKTLIANYPNLGRFLGKFTDAFRSRRSPAVLMLKSTLPKSYFTAEAVAGFRDLIVAAVVPYSRVRSIKAKNPIGAVFSNTFDFYPWMISNDYDETMLGQTPALTALHVIAEFSGQTSPEIPTIILMPTDVDEPLLKSLLRRWRRRFSGGRVRWDDRKLFRSLNMANQAMQIPGSSDTGLYDYGRLFGLWVSAFEILAHPRVQKSNAREVYKLLERVSWEEKACKAKRFVANSGGKQRRPLACWLYGEIYKARNAFFHGNPVTPKTTKLKSGKYPLFHYPASLYRLALTGFLLLSWKGPFAPMSQPMKLGRQMADRMHFTGYQEEAERMIKTARSNLR